MAQLVGDAYVRIYGDTSALRRAIKREEAYLAAAGEDGADSYLTNFSQTIRDRADARLKQAQISLADAIAGGDFGPMLKRSGMQVDEFVRNVSLDLKRLQDAGHFESMTDDVDDYHSALESLNDWAGKNKLVAEQARITEAVKRNTIATREGFAAWRDYNNETRVSLGFANDHEVTMRRWSNSIDRTTILLNRHSEATGRMFGAGSRSEFLNFFGRLIGHMSALPALAVQGFGRMAAFGADLVEQFHDLRDASGGSFENVGQLSGALLKMGGRLVAFVLPAVAAFVIGIGAMTVLMPALLSLIGSLLGALVAVAGAITIGVIGALLALAPLVIAVAAGLGGVVLGMTGVDETSRKLRKTLKPLQDAFARIKREISRGFISELAPQIAGLTRAMNISLLPMMKNMMVAVGEIARELGLVFNSEQLRPFIDAFNISLPKIFARLGIAAGRFAAGLVAFFKPILPYAERLAAKLQEAAQTFLDWATSAEGQNSIADFMERAWSMAGKLWGIIKNIGSIIWSVFNAGSEGPGGDFLGWLERVTGQFADFLKTPEGQTAVHDFFEDVKNVMISIRDIFGVISTKMSEMDWDQAAEDVQTVLDVITSIVTVFGATWTFIAGVVSVMRTTWDEEWADMEERWKSITDFFNGLPAAVTAPLLALPTLIIIPFSMAWESVTGFLSRLDITGFIARLPQQAAQALARLPAVMAAPFTLGSATVFALLGTLIANVGSFIGRIPGIIGSGLTSVVARFAQPFQNAAATVRGWLLSIGLNVLMGILAIPGIVSRGLAGLAGAFVGPLANAYRTVQGWIANIRRLFDGLLSFARTTASLVSGLLGAGRGMSLGGGTAPTFGPGGAATQPRGGPGPRGGARGASPLGDALTLRGLANLTLPDASDFGQQQARAERVINFHPGSIVVSSRAEDPAIVAAEVVDRIAARVSYV